MPRPPSSATATTVAFSGKKRYEIKEEIGRGACGRVHRGLDLALRREVAIKVVDAELAETPTTLAWNSGLLMREAQAAARLRHLHVVTVFDIFEDSGAHFLVMELISGQSLDKKLIRRTPLDRDEGLRILRQIAGALDYVHTQGIVHRDIKPSNILIELDGTVKIADFGISRMIRLPTLGAPGTIIGTPLYMAPEQCSGAGAELDGRTDQYSLASVAFRLLTGEAPFERVDNKLLMSHVRDSLPPLASSINKSLKFSTDAVLERALHKRRTERYHTCSAFMDDLEKSMKDTMPYRNVATSDAPALIVYLLDSSGSMAKKLDGVPRIQRVIDATIDVFKMMIMRSTKGGVVSPRYKVAVASYSSAPIDVFGGVLSIDTIANNLDVNLKADDSTDTESAFKWARDLLHREMKGYGARPAPMVCHLTDGKYTGRSPVPIAQEIMQMQTEDGHVLVENIYVEQDLTLTPIVDVETWPGVATAEELTPGYARDLFDMSSPLPDTYAALIADKGYSLRSGSRMLFPVSNPELLRLAFAVSGATKTR